LKLQVGDKVLLFDETVRRGRSWKLNGQWIGPYTITVIDKVNATITKGCKSTKVYVTAWNRFIEWREDSKRRVYVLLQMRFELVTLVIWTVCRMAVGNSGYELSVYQESNGIYFEDLGHATLSTATWTVVVYSPIPMTSETTNLEQYVHYIDRTCSRLTVKTWTACSHFGDTMARDFSR
jgi:hypothetical protein